MIASRPAVMMSHSCLERSSILGAESKMDQSTAEKNRPSSAFLLARVSRLEINFLLGPARDGLFLVRTMTTLYNVIYIMFIFSWFNVGKQVMRIAKLSTGVLDFDKQLTLHSDALGIARQQM